MDCVRDVMVSNLVTVHEGATVCDAAKVMAQHNIGSLVVVPGDFQQGSRLRVSETGLITERDIMSRVVAKDRPTNIKVREVYHRSPLMIDSHCSVTEAFDYIERHRIRWLLVSSGSEVVGIMTLKDLNKAVRFSSARRLLGVHEREHVKSDGYWRLSRF